MSTSVALAAAKSGGLAAFSEGLKNLQNTVKAEGVDDGLFARMNGKSGIWETNYPGTTSFPNGSEFVFNMFGATVVHMGFDDNKKVYFSPKQPVAVSSGQNLPDPENIPAVTRWTKMMRVNVAPGDTGKQIMLSGKADKPFRNIWKLLQQYGQQAVMNPDPGSSTGYKMPIVKIGSKELEAKIPEKKVVVNQQTGKEEVVSVITNVQYFVETYEITSWITEAEMQEIMEANGVEAAAAAAGPAAVDTVIKADVHAEVKGQVEEAQVIEVIPPTKANPPPGVAPSGAGGSFQRMRAGQTGVRTG